ncbi:hypothetical protein LguiB_020596 [Lonicera macranthoides]
MAKHAYHSSVLRAPYNLSLSKCPGFIHNSRGDHILAEVQPSRPLMHGIMSRGDSRPCAALVIRTPPESEPA